LLLLIVNYNHPFTTNARIYFSVPVLHSVLGRVTEVPVQANTPLKEGDAPCSGGVPAQLPAAGEDGRRGRVAFGAVPGHAFKGKVRVVLGGIAAGQIQATGALVASAPARKGQLRWATSQEVFLRRGPLIHSILQQRAALSSSERAH